MKINPLLPLIVVGLLIGILLTTNKNRSRSPKETHPSPLDTLKKKPKMATLRTPIMALSALFLTLVALHLVLAPHPIPPRPPHPPKNTLLEKPQQPHPTIKTLRDLTPHQTVEILKTLGPEKHTDTLATPPPKQNNK